MDRGPQSRKQIVRRCSSIRVWFLRGLRTSSSSLRMIWCNITVHKMWFIRQLSLGKWFVANKAVDGDEVQKWRATRVNQPHTCGILRPSQEHSHDKAHWLLDKWYCRPESLCLRVIWIHCRVHQLPCKIHKEFFYAVRNIDLSTMI